MMHLRSVLLPEPLTPQSATVRPAGIERVAEERALGGAGGAGGGEAMVVVVMAVAVVVAAVIRAAEGVT